MSFNCVNTPLIPNPIGIDYIISRIQNGLSSLSWLNYSFGKAYRKKEERDGIIYDVPKVWIGSNDFQSVEPNDNVGAYSWVESFETEFISDFEVRRFDHISRIDLSVVVFANLNLIDNTRDYIFTEELKSDVFKILSNVPEIESINSISEGMDEAYRRWSIETIKPTYYAEKYTAFRIDFTAVINSACYSQNIYTKNNC